MSARAGPGDGPVAGFCAALSKLRQSSGYEVPALARRLNVSRAQLYAILSGDIKRPPDWAKIVGPLVEACTDGDKRALTAWRHRHSVLVDVCDELNRRNRARRPAADLSAPPPAGQVVVGEIPREPLGYVARDLLDVLASVARRERLAVVCTVTGLRGVGKTQLAAAYARQRVSEGWDMVGWVNAETADTLLAGLARLARRLGVADPEGDSLESARRLHEHLSTRPQAGLLVLDNATDPGGLRPFLPASGHTQVVITSANQAFAELGGQVEVDTFSRAESVAYLVDRTGLADLSGAGAIADGVGDLPLGLAQAAATIRRRHLTYAQYLSRLSRVPIRELLGAIPGGDYPRSVSAALLLSVEDAEAGDPTGLTGLLLRAVAALSPHGVRRDLLGGLAAAGEACPGEACPGEDAVSAAVDRCVAGSLLTWSVTGDAVIMHRLLGRLLRERDHACGRWPATVTACLELLESRQFCAGEAWARREEGVHLIAQTEALCQAAAAAGASSPGQQPRLLRARSWAAGQLRATADYSRAINLGAQLVADQLAAGGPGHPDTLAAQEDLAGAYVAAGSPEQAIPLYQRVLAAREQSPGPDHPSTLASRNNLAEAYWSANRATEAIPLHQQALAARERILGPDHPDTLLSRGDLASAYWSVGWRERATALYEATLADYERVLGADDPATLTALNNLAAAYALGNRVGEAIPLHERALAARRHVIGPDHPDTLLSQNNLAHSYQSAGRPGEAIALHKRTLAARERLLGPAHPDTLSSRDNLASALAAAGQLEEAIALHTRVLADREQLFGADHLSTLKSCDHLAVALALAGRPGEAIPWYERALAARERILGPSHPDTVDSREHLQQAQSGAHA